MKHGFATKAPLIRLAFAAAALSATLSVGGFIDFIASGYAVAADLLYGSTLIAERKS